MKILRTLLMLVIVNAVCMFIGLNAGRYVAKKYDEYKFKSVVNGDVELMRIYSKKEGRIVRILGVDAPELNECLGQEAKDFLGYIIDNKKLVVHKAGVDSSGRIVALITIDGVDIAPQILRSGMARVDDVSKYHIKADSRPSEDYLHLLRESENEAKNLGVGLWGDKCVTKDIKK